MRLAAKVVVKGTTSEIKDGGKGAGKVASVEATIACLPLL
jgi:hypothetical protein